MENNNEGRNNGKFAKGNSFGGRTKGSKNKATQNIRETFLKFIESNLDRMQEDYDLLDAKDRFAFLFQMTKFILPSLKAVEFGNVLDELTEDEFAVIIEKLKSEYSQN